jgi:zinc D-Ala-D-Ala carboxypeptidase
MPKNLTDHFTLEELTISQTAAREGIDNTPDAAALANLRTLAAVLERVRSALGNHAVAVSSGYRCPALNAAIGGSKTSAHMDGRAADFIVPAFGTVLQTARAIAASGIGFDQLIYEYGRWIHLGLAAPGKTARGELLSIGAKGKYVSGLTTNC